MTGQVEDLHITAENHPCENYFLPASPHHVRLRRRLCENAQSFTTNLQVTSMIEPYISYMTMSRGGEH